MNEGTRTTPRDRAYAITEEMAARAQDPRCPRPLALLLVSWVNALNAVNDGRSTTLRFLCWLLVIAACAAITQGLATHDWRDIAGGLAVGWAVWLLRRTEEETA